MSTTMSHAAPPPITLADVARRAGVSRATVSLVMRESPLVAKSTRERVRAAAEDLGYIYNRGAANLRANRTKMVGLLVTDVSAPFFSEMTIGVDAALDAADYIAFLANTGESLDRQERFLRRMREQNVDGIILCPSTGSTSGVLRQIAEWGMPCVQTLRHISSREGDYVGVDYELGMDLVTSHLLRLGHRKIAFVGGDRPNSALLSRRKGFLATIERHGLQPTLIYECAATRLGGFQAIGPVLDRPDPPTAVVCFNDLVALGFMTALHGRGLRPGLDVAVTGVDDIPDAQIGFPALTTLATRPRELGEAATRLLLRRIERNDGPAERIILPTHLVVRGSCGAFSTPDDGDAAET